MVLYSLRGSDYMKAETLFVLQSIYVLTNVISNLYHILIKLESKEQTSTKHYENVLNLLHIAKNQEDKLYNYFKNNPDEMKSAYICT